jgi:hypothetical protein
MGVIDKVAIGEFFLVLIMIGLGYWYYHDTQQTILALNVNNAQLTTAVATQKAVIQAELDEVKKQNDAMTKLQKSADASENARRDLEDKLHKHNLTAIARRNAAGLQSRINSATVKAFSDIEHLTDPNPSVPTTTATKK